MFPVLIRFVSRYAPYVTLPVAAVIGIIGYNLENYLSDKYTPYEDSIAKTRRERMLQDQLNEPVASDSLKEKKFVPNTIFERNLSPSLQNKD